MSFCACASFDENLFTEKETDLFFKEWMKYLKNDTLLTELVIPGSHDAGSYNIGGMEALNILGETQDSDIYTQLNAGVRYFDIRVNNGYIIDDNGTKINDVLKIFHSVLNFGLCLNQVLDQIKIFLEENESEFLILDFQHFEDNVEERVLDMLNDKFNVSDTALKNDADLSALSMGDIKNSGARMIIIWGSKDTYDSDFVFKRKECLISPYIEDNHCCGPKYLINTSFDDYYSQKQNGKFFVLQSVLSLYNPFGDNKSDNVVKYGSIKEAENDFNGPMNEYIRSLLLSENATALNMNNIIMRDFCTLDMEKQKTVLSLNMKKNFVKNEFISLFSLMTEKN